MSGVYSIYVITLYNGQQYVGFTSRDPQLRLKEHLKCDSTTKFYRALRKYKLASFEVIKVHFDEEEALKDEIHEISKRHLVKNGLNTDPGGYGATMHIIPTFNEDGTTTYKINEFGAGRAPKRTATTYRGRRRYTSRRPQRSRRN